MHACQGLGVWAKRLKTADLPAVHRTWMPASVVTTMYVASLCWHARTEWMTSVCCDSTCTPTPRAGAGAGAGAHMSCAVAAQACGRMPLQRSGCGAGSSEKHACMSVAHACTP